MLSISKPKPASGKGSYYFDYYGQDISGQSFWFGKGADVLGLSGAVSKGEFTKLLNGFAPNGKGKLLSNSGDPNRNAFWDLTFSVPKSVSGLWVVSPDEIKERIDAGIDRALLSTLCFVEERYGLSRIGAGGRKWVPAALTMAIFGHISSRENQPQLHRHVVLFNLGIREDGTVGTLQTKPLFEAKLKLGNFFAHELAKELEADLKCRIEKAGTEFQIGGVPEDVCKHFSKRNQQIRNYLRENNLSGGKAAKVAAEKTRAPKQHIPKEELVKQWQKESAAKGFCAADAEKLLGHQQKKANASPCSEEKENQIFSSSKHKTHGTSKAEQPNPVKSEEEKKSQTKDSEHTKTSSETKREEKSKSKVKAKTAPPKTETDPKILKAYERELRKAVDRIWAENQKRPKIERFAFAVAKKHKVTSRDVVQGIDKLQLPIHHRFYRVEYKPLFPTAPNWNRLAHIRLPRFVLFNQPHKWGHIYYSKPIPALFGPKKEFRVQERMLFPKAPGWNPLSKLSVKVLHIGAYRPHAYEENKNPKKNETQKEKAVNKKEHSL